MGFKTVVGLMMGCFGMGNCLRIADQSTQIDLLETSESKSTSSVAADPLITSPRIKLGDGRFLAYRERGVPIDMSNYRVVIVHGFASSKEMDFMASQKLMDELGVYLVSFDRAGYGESDPNQKRSLKSEASDIQELADQLKLGSKFYVIGVSVGAYPTWSCIKHMPERLAGVVFVVPYVNYRWPSLPDDLTKDDYRKNLSRWTAWVARHTPGLVRWWLTQKVFPSSSVLDRNPKFFSKKDLEVLKNTPGYQLVSKGVEGVKHTDAQFRQALELLGSSCKLKQPEIFDSLRRDFILAFGKWDFDPLNLSNPFAQSDVSVHIWQGYEDKVVPVELQRYVVERLPWILYHEVPDGGHLLVYDNAVCEAILRSLLLGEDQPLYRPKFVI